VDNGVYVIGLDNTQMRQLTKVVGVFGANESIRSRIKPAISFDKSNAIYPQASHVYLGFKFT
jgi:hypothetical protein